MKTQSFNSKRSARSALTLVEVLVVIGVIGVLAGMITASVGHAKAAAQSVGCKGNLRQQGLALIMYRSEFRAYPNHKLKGMTGTTFWFDRLETYSGGMGWDDPLFRCPGYRGYTANGTDVITPLGSYAYNAFGIGANIHGLGLGRSRFGPDQPIRQGGVRLESDMIAIGDANLVQAKNYTHGRLHGPLKPSGYAWYHRQYGMFGLRQQDLRNAIQRRHSGVYNLLFCDGHVEGLTYRKLFRVTESALQRWNNDNEPHREKLIQLESKD